MGFRQVTLRIEAHLHDHNGPCDDFSKQQWELMVREIRMIVELYMNATPLDSDLTAANYIDIQDSEEDE